MLQPKTWVNPETFRLKLFVAWPGEEEEGDSNKDEFYNPEIITLWLLINGHSISTPVFARD